MPNLDSPARRNRAWKKALATARLIEKGWPLSKIWLHLASNENIDKVFCEIESAAEDVGESADDLPASAANMTKTAKALATLADHPDWPNERIAEAAGCHVKSLSRMPKFKAARAALRGSQFVLRGSKDRESGRMEAWIDDE